MECELTKLNVVDWQRHGHAIMPDNRIKISSNNCSHQLEIDDVTMDDGGTYTCICGEENTKCEVTVESKA